MRNHRLKALLNNQLAVLDLHRQGGAVSQAPAPGNSTSEMSARMEPLRRQRVPKTFVCAASTRCEKWFCALSGPYTLIAASGRQEDRSCASAALKGDDRSDGSKQYLGSMRQHICWQLLTNPHKLQQHTKAISKSQIRPS